LDFTKQTKKWPGGSAESLYAIMCEWKFEPGIARKTGEVRCRKDRTDVLNRLAVLDCGFAT
jgi:hypothetical protein